VSSGVDLGASIRVVKGPTTSFGYTDSLHEGALIALADRLSSSLSGSAASPAPLSAVPVEPIRSAAGSDVGAQTARKAEIVRLVDRTARERSSEVRQVLAGYSEGLQRVRIANSEGVYTGDTRARVAVAITVIAQRDGLMQTGRETVARLGGFDVLRDEDVVAATLQAADKAVVMLGARPSPSGRMPVILANGFGGVLFHEACGHGLEADFILKKTSIWEGRRGQKVAESLLTAYDDGACAGMWGSNAIDDEGTPTERTAVIEGGVLTGYLCDLLRGRQLGFQSSGNGRRQSFRHLPYPRMTNTYFAPGDVRADDLIADTPRAFYAKSLSGGQVDPATGDFVFGVAEGYLIENGLVGPAVRGATLIGNGAEVLRMIDAVADDLEIKAGMCGKEGQLVPVGTGQPTVRLRELTVGGTEV
jgi:Predicted Zn-dependent proteases and their inactivated homologs